MEGKTIRIYLPEGSPSGVLVLEIINWTGKVVVGPRSRLPELINRPETSGSGIYLLVGDDPEQTGRELVYVGEGDEVRKRLYYHEKDESKDFWNRTIVVTSKDANLTKAHVRYLESRLIGLIQQAGRARLGNGTAPTPPPLPEPDIADMEFFLAQVQMILPVVGFNFTKPKPQAQLAAGATPKSAAVSDEGMAAESPDLIMEKVGARAEARESDGEFVVFKGSTARREGLDSWTSYKALRAQLVDEGKLVISADPDLLVFTEDVTFASPSAAAAVVYGGNQNGRLAWRVKATGVTYKEWQETKLQQAGVPYLEDEA